MRASISPFPFAARLAPRATAAAALTASLAGCSLFAPSDTPPAMPSPAHYGATPLPERTAAAQGLTQRFDVGAQPVPDWWKRYRSPALDALVDEGLRNSPTLAAADKSLTAAREQLRAQIGSSLLPSIDAGGQATRERALGVPTFGPQTVLYNVFAGQLQASYTLDLFGAAHFANRALSKRVDVTAYQLESTRRALAANIVTAAVTSAALAEQVATTERLVALAREQANDTAARHRLGAASRTDMLNAQQSAAALEASLPALRQQWQTTRHALAVLLGRTPDQASADLALADLHLPQDVPVVVPSTLLQARPDIRAAEAGLQAAAAEVGVATAQLFPQLSLSASMGHAGFNWPAMLSGAGAIWSVGASLTQPLFHGGALLAQRRAARATYEAAVDQYKQTVLAAFQDVADKLAALDNDASALDASNRSAVAARGAFDDTAARVRLGALPPSAARASEQQYRNARLDEIRATGTRLVDTARLFQAMGTPTDGGKDAKDTKSASGADGANDVGATQRANDAKRTGDAGDAHVPGTAGEVDAAGASGAAGAAAGAMVATNGETNSENAPGTQPADGPR
ncbi:efflux transporter outer membrane subunit [Burkholderia sp. ABCPW 111]|uniref:efflux transporter outer membrane subunit n=1 Tax=Burkholderia sp. ABCPW 111 TaxID=1820025 RepID=UPI00053203A9|nr:efflux transporter outer membrane subunit [Burkholderia sp. ABCPW 111]KGS08814.1 efflux transporter, outer membrane factor (OMF) lipo, NodT family protein [Burkholderia sp. ABCPW 111]